MVVTEQVQCAVYGKMGEMGGWGFALFGGFAQHHLRADNQIALQGIGVVVTTFKTQNIGGVIFATVVAVVAAGLLFVKQHQADVDAAAVGFECLPQPAVKIGFGGDGKAAAVVKIQDEALAQNAGKGKITAAFAGAGVESGHNDAGKKRGLLQIFGQSSIIAAVFPFFMPIKS